LPAPAHHLGPGPRGAYTTLALAGAGIFAFSCSHLLPAEAARPLALTSGLAFLPLTGVLVVTSTTVQTRVIQHTGSSRWSSLVGARAIAMFCSRA